MCELQRLVKDLHIFTALHFRRVTVLLGHRQLLLPHLIRERHSFKKKEGQTIYQLKKVTAKHLGLIKMPLWSEKWQRHGMLDTDTTQRKRFPFPGP